jgi:hypothetical protein
VLARYDDAPEAGLRIPGRIKRFLFSADYGLDGLGSIQGY